MIIDHGFSLMYDFVRIMKSFLVRLMNELVRPLITLFPRSVRNEGKGHYNKFSISGFKLAVAYFFFFSSSDNLNVHNKNFFFVYVHIPIP